MDPSAPPPQRDEELAELRRRAYGPDADIHADPSAQARLHQLEDEMRADRRPLASDVELESAEQATFEVRRSPLLSDAVGFAAETPPLTTVHVAQVDSGEIHRDGDEPTVASSARPWRRRHAAAVSAVVAIILTVAVGSSLLALASPRSDATLAEISASPEESAHAIGQGIIDAYALDRESLRRHESFRSLSVWAASSLRGERCLLILTGRLVVIGLSCTPHDLDPIVDLYAYAGRPDSIFGDLPRGSVIRFVLHDDTVEVRVVEPVSSA